MLLPQKRLVDDEPVWQTYLRGRRCLTDRFLYALVAALLIGTITESNASRPTRTDTEWRHCAIEGALVCPRNEQCDMLRNRCVPVCEGNDCCHDVHCPTGSECVKIDGRCGIPVGDQCFDMGTSWWTGRDVPTDQSLTTIPLPVDFTVSNNSSRPLYFITLQGRPIRFEIYDLESGPERKLELAENHYCPNPCPTQGPARERDCEPPLYEVRPLPPAGHISMVWSGKEEVGMQRLCEKNTAGFCMVSRVTQPGLYAVEVCATAEILPVEKIQTMQKDKLKCWRTLFTHPTADKITILIDD